MKSSGWRALVLSVGVAACGGEATRENPEGAIETPGGRAPIEEPLPTGGSGGSPMGAPAGGSAAANDAGAPAAAAGDGPELGGSGPDPGAGGGESAGANADAGAAGAPSDEPIGAGCDPITFEDPELELAVRSELGKPAGPLSAADVVGFTELFTPSITSLKGVECLLDLTTLDIGSQPPSQVTDLTPLRPLKKLVVVDLDRNPLASLEPLGELPNLEQLFMIRMPVELDLTPLASAPKLASLAMQSDTIATLAPLGAVSSLRSLSIDGATLRQADGVALLRSLEELTATGVFDDAAPLSTLTKLQRLRIGQKPLAHFEALDTLRDLRLLDVSNTGVTDLSPVAQMHELRFLSASNNAITDLGPLVALPQLNVVALVSNQITDLEPLADNLAIGEGDSLFLQGNPFSCAAQAPSVQALQGRGAQVNTDCP